MITYQSPDIGPSQVFKVKSTPVFDFQNGVVWVDEWVGTLTGIQTLAATLYALGARVQAEYSVSPKLTATFSRDPSISASNEVPVDEYRFSAEAYEQSLFSLPKAIQEGNDSYGGISYYKKQIEDAARDGDPYPYLGNNPFGRTIYNLLTQGVQAVRRRRIILSRVRKFSATYTGQIVLDSSEKVWTTARLVSDFSIPTVVANKLPANPSSDNTPQGTQWAWLITSDESTYIPKTNQFEEHKTWAFAAWVTDLYEVLS